MPELLIQGALAAILLMGMIAVVLIELWRGQPVNIPDALVVAVGAVVGFFFGARSAVAGSAAASAAANETVRTIREDPRPPIPESKP
ncbi:MAG: hypothetical protein AUG49_15990 [Catenulispora sp. 13_1_20CM_3_70_7]|nr:MAG: hypothetical protein AUG49_15990 [Catenulispora sp. 13_1_20CM_3_70_7]